MPEEKSEQSIDSIVDKLKETVNKINLKLSNGKEKLIICYSDNCMVCDEYLDKIKEYKGKENSLDVVLLNVDLMEEKIWARTYDVRGLPCTFFMDRENKLKGKIDGIIEGKDINMIANTIYGK